MSFVHFTLVASGHFLTHIEKSMHSCLQILTYPELWNNTFIIILFFRKLHFHFNIVLKRAWWHVNINALDWQWLFYLLFYNLLFSFDYCPRWSWLSLWKWNIYCCYHYQFQILRKLHLDPHIWLFHLLEHLELILLLYFIILNFVMRTD